jgi:hypothetical protein
LWKWKIEIASGAFSSLFGKEIKTLLDKWGLNSGNDYEEQRSLGSLCQSLLFAFYRGDIN